MEIDYRASDEVRDVIASLGRTEDVRFSPNNRRLAIAAFRQNAVAVFDIEIGSAGGKPQVTLSRVTRCTSPFLNYPHGLDFIDDDTIAIVSRGGDVPILKLPASNVADPICEMLPVQILRADEIPSLISPGSVAVLRPSQAPHELLICNSGGNTVTKHVLSGGQDGAAAGCSILLRKWLGIPDGVCISSDQRWIAISNHDAHNVMLYRNEPFLHEGSDPDGILRSVTYPHGVRFTADGRHILLADAGAPYIHVYASKDGNWQGLHNPLASIRVMAQSTYQAGRHNPKEGGPKGIDLDKSMSVLATTCECQPLAFFDLPEILQRASEGSRVLELSYELHLVDETIQAQAKVMAAERRAAGETARAKAAAHRAAYETARAEKFKAKAAKAKRKAAKGVVRRIAAPLGRLYSAWKRPN
ncbi:MAG TPA: hypothetical protein VJV39_23780 [Dongiaceae bacterium]|nr:hypothetical protein [Dongiaceae bacterium]